jgi:two-component system OmpR family response regulator
MGACMPNTLSASAKTSKVVIEMSAELSNLHVLVVEDDGKLADETATWLREGGLAATVARDGAEGLQLALAGEFDVLVVDRMMPQLDGLGLTQKLRASGCETPILMVTALGAVSDRIAGLEGGADDYLVKPFALAELRARIQALARRSGSKGDSIILRAGGLSLNRLKRNVVRDGTEIDLLPLEFRLLERLALNAGRVVTRAMLLETVWGFHFDPRTNIVETHISRLRRKIDREGQPSLIAHIRSAGYVLAA